jgi:hypothetical protein
VPQNAKGDDNRALDRDQHAPASGASMAMALALVALTLACGPKLPPRFVIERDVEPARYRRYQKVLDVEIPVAGNPAVGHTATYAQSGKRLLITPVFVTVYEHAKGLTETVRGRLRAMAGYETLVAELHGENVWTVKGESDDRWIMWVSGPHLVKIGVAEGGKQAPDALVEAYLEVYPSDLDERGHAREEALSAGAALVAGEEEPSP